MIEMYFIITENYKNLMKLWKEILITAYKTIYNITILLKHNNSLLIEKLIVTTIQKFNIP